MPKAVLSAARIERLLGRPLPRAELVELLFASKTQVEGGSGDALEVEGTADRLDLLTEAGVATHLQGVLGLARGRPVAPLLDPVPMSFLVDPSVAPLRPAIAGVVVTPPEGRRADADVLEEAIRFQELLHATIGMDRRLASLGIYPVERLRGPVLYAMEPLDAIRFTPLEAAGPVGAATFFAGHPMAERYAPYGRSGDRCLTLRDAAGTILSLPPILNSREGGEARVGDGALLIESTGTRDSRVRDAVALLSLVFTARGWSAGPVAVTPEPRGGARSALAARRLEMSDRVLYELAGTHLPSDEVGAMLARARFDAHRSHAGWSIEAAPWRVDLHGAVDVVEDLLIARGLHADEGELLGSATRGARSPSARFRARVSDLLLGLSFVPLYTPVLVPERLATATGRSGALALSNPLSDQFSRLRDSLLLSLCRTLERNVRHGYPQRFSEVGPVVVGSGTFESGAETRHHAGMLLASDTAGFADGAALVDCLMRALGAVGVREPAELPGTIPGRAAQIRLAGALVGEVGELSPALLRELRVPVPVVWAELDLTALETLHSAPGAAPSPGA